MSMTYLTRPIGTSAPGLGRSSARHPIRRVSRTSPGSGRELPVLAAETRPAYDADGVDQIDPMLNEVVAQLEKLADLVPDRDTGEALAKDGQLDADTLERWVRQLRRIDGTFTTLKATVVGLGEAVKVAEKAGMASTGQWLKDRFNTSSREASRQQHLAQTLDQLPRTRQAVASGQLGSEQAAVLGQAARRGRLGTPEETEAALLEAARGSTPEQLRERVRRAEQAADGDALRRDENRQHALRRASCVKQDDGMWRLDALLTGVDGEVVATALNAFTTPDPAGTPRSLRRRAEQRTADGLVALAHAVLDGKTAPQAGGLKPHLMVLVPFDGPGPWRPELLEDARRHIGRLARGGSGVADGNGGTGRGGPDDEASHEGCSTTDASAPLAQTAGGTVLSPEATSRLLCDARITRVVLSGRSEILDAGRTTRGWTTAQRAALVARDRGCRGPGCDRPAAWCDAHHVVFWSRKGSTDLANGILLCHQHHHLVHEGGWALTLDPTSSVARFTDPFGNTHTTYPPGADPPADNDRGAEAPAHDRGAEAPAHDRGAEAPAHDRDAEAPAHDRDAEAPAHGRDVEALAHDRDAEALALPLANAPPD
jgi:hypothetical protein